MRISRLPFWLTVLSLFLCLSCSKEENTSPPSLNAPADLIGKQLRITSVKQVGDSWCPVVKPHINNVLVPELQQGISQMRFTSPTEVAITFDRRESVCESGMNYSFQGSQLSILSEPLLPEYPITAQVSFQDGKMTLQFHKADMMRFITFIGDNISTVSHRIDNHFLYQVTMEVQ